MTASEISHVTIRGRRSWRTGKAPNSGLVTIHPVSGRPTKYVLIGHQDPHFVVRLLQEAGIRVEQA